VNTIPIMGNENYHQRKPMRLYGYDYSQKGAYYITIITKDRKNIFGCIMGDEVELSLAGQVAQVEWSAISTKFPYIDLDEFVIMPNHIHGILFIQNPGQFPNQPRSESTMINGAPKNSIISVIENYKSLTSRKIRQLNFIPGGQVWHTRFYDHIIRGYEEFEKIREYIVNNPSKWNRDEENR
jgi:putative transposase